MPDISVVQTCSQCGSRLILINQVTEFIDGSRFPQTTSTYRCSNEDCQEKREKETAKRIKLQKDKEDADKLRQEKKVHEKKTIAEQVEKKFNAKQLHTA